MKLRNWLAVWIPIQATFLYLTTIPSLNVYHEVVITNLVFTVTFFIIMYKKCPKLPKLEKVE